MKWSAHVQYSTVEDRYSKRLWAPEYVIAVTNNTRPKAFKRVG